MNPWVAGAIGLGAGTAIGALLFRREPMEWVALATTNGDAAKLFSDTLDTTGIQNKFRSTLLKGKFVVLVRESDFRAGRTAPAFDAIESKYTAQQLMGLVTPMGEAV